MSRLEKAGSRERGAWRNCREATDTSSSYSFSNESRTSRSRRTSRIGCSSPLPAPGGFSLAEVLIAIAIISFALLALVGVLPQGLQSLQNAQRQEAEARIVQHVAARYQLKAWAELASMSTGADFLDFDGNGAPVSSSSNDHIYRARADVLDAAPLPNETAASPYLRRLRIRITNQFNTAGAFDDPARHRERWVTLVDLDKTPPPAAPVEPPNPAGSPTSGTPGGTTNP